MDAREVQYERIYNLKSLCGRTFQGTQLPTSMVVIFFLDSLNMCGPVALVLSAHELFLSKIFKMNLTAIVTQNLISKHVFALVSELQPYIYRF